MTATLVSGLVESLGVILALLLVARASESGGAIMMMTTLPGLVLLVLPGLGRAFGAVFLRETGGSAPVAFAFETLRALGALRERRDRSFVPLTRSAFWERLGRPDTVEASPDGTLVFRGLLPHLTWGGSRRLSVGRDHWSVVPEPPALDRGRLVYSYRLEPLGDAPAPGEPPPCAPPATAYSEEVVQDARREWDGLNEGFAWLTCMLPADVQGAGLRAPRRAGRGKAGDDGHGGRVRRPGPLPTELPAGGPAADPLAPFVGGLAVGLLLDAVLRVRATRQGRYAPSLFARPPLGLAPPRARALPRPPRRRASSPRSNGRT